MTKRELIQAALNEIGIADYEFDITPEELSSGVRRLDMMLSTWAHKGLRIPYNFGGGIEDDSGIPATAQEAVTLNLATRLGPSYGKQAPVEVMGLAKSAYSALLSESAYPIEIQIGVPKGAGHKRVDETPFFKVQQKGTWEIDGFEDYSGGAGTIQLGDVGTAIRISLAGSMDLSTAVAQTIRYRKPSGDTGEWTATVVGDTVEYITVAGDIDEAGVWYIQAYVDLTTWQGTSKAVSLRVEQSIELE